MSRRRLPAPCNHPACPTITVDTYCAAHAQPARRSPAWPRLRAAVLAAEPACRDCGRPATEVDHIVPLRRGGAELDAANCQPLCRRCHHIKTRNDP